MINPNVTQSRFAEAGSCQQLCQVRIDSPSNHLALYRLPIHVATTRCVLWAYPIASQPVKPAPWSTSQHRRVTEPSLAQCEVHINDTRSEEQEPPARPRQPRAPGLRRLALSVLRLALLTFHRHGFRLRLAAAAFRVLRLAFLPFHQSGFRLRLLLALRLRLLAFRSLLLTLRARLFSLRLISLRVVIGGLAFRLRLALRVLRLRFLAVCRLALFLRLSLRGLLLCTLTGLRLIPALRVLRLISTLRVLRLLAILSVRCWLPIAGRLLARRVLLPCGLRLATLGDLKLLSSTTTTIRRRLEVERREVGGHDEVAHPQLAVEVLHAGAAPPDGARLPGVVVDRVLVGVLRHAMH